MICLSWSTVGHWRCFLCALKGHNIQERRAVATRSEGDTTTNGSGVPADLAKGHPAAQALDDAISEARF